MSETQLADRIVVDPEIRFGKPRIAGTRVSVVDILEALAAGDTAEEIVEALPYVTLSDIQAVLKFAAQNIDQKFAA
jgi:uncharacterized protein (DUF433 family)